MKKLILLSILFAASSYSLAAEKMPNIPDMKIKSITSCYTHYSNPNVFLPALVITYTTKIPLDSVSVYTTYILNGKKKIDTGFSQDFDLTPGLENDLLAYSTSGFVGDLPSSSQVVTVLVRFEIKKGLQFTNYKFALKNPVVSVMCPGR